MTTPFLLADLKRDEGLRLTAYPDPLSKGPPWTIGYGHTGREVHPGLTWTEIQANGALVQDVALTMHGLDTAIGWWRTLDDARQDVLVNMGFELGVHGLLGFPKALAAIEAGDWPQAKAELIASAWDHQVPERAGRQIEQMFTGVRL